MTKMRSVAIYGKGGIGKSTTTSNLSAALADMGKRVIQIGCDPKSDSTNNLRGGRSIPTVLDAIRSGKPVELDDIVYEGFGGVLCIEAGGPEPGVGCAGRGIIAAIELLRQKKVFEEYKPDVVLYDVLGDVVCGGFSVPIREGVAEQVYTVTSADFMAIYAANNLFKGIQKYANSGGALFSGIIANSVTLPIQREIIDDFASRTGTTIAEYIPAVRYDHPERTPGPDRNRVRSGLRAGRRLSQPCTNTAAERGEVRPKAARGSGTESVGGVVVGSAPYEEERRAIDVRVTEYRLDEHVRACR